MCKALPETQIKDMINIDTGIDSGCLILHHITLGLHSLMLLCDRMQ